MATPESVANRRSAVARERAARATTPAETDPCR
jgi:hypothetical protein